MEMRPAPFADLEFASALERATAECKLLLVDATAAWFGPCQVMDRTTWIDPAVIAWIRAHALAIKIPVDTQKEVARQLRIVVTPTIIAFAGGKEFDRILGAKKPKELLAWLEGVRHGETSLVVRKRRVQGKPADMSARLELAREQTRAGCYDEAIVEYVWLWEHMLEHEPAMYGVRLSFFASDLEKLVRLHPRARTAIEQLRDRAAPPASGPIEVETFRDWICLNGVLGEQGRALVWYDGLPAESRRARLGPLLEHDIIPLLVDAERWADAGALYEQPLWTIDRAVDMVVHQPSDVPAEMLERFREMDGKHFRELVTNLVRALCAAGRVQEVDLVAQRARTVDPSKEMRRALADASRSR